MKARTVALFFAASAFLFCCPCHCPAETHILSNRMTTYIDGFDQYGIRFHDVGGGIDWVCVRTFDYVTFSGDPHSQSFSGVTHEHMPTPRTVETGLFDHHGNPCRDAHWGEPGLPYDLPAGLYRTIIIFTAYSDAQLDGMASTISFPLPGGSVPPDVDRYMDPGPGTQSDEPDVVALAESLSDGCSYEYEAVRAILNWCVDNLHYSSLPLEWPQDALSTIQDPLHYADCTGYSHVAIALLRAIGIPARFVVGPVLAGAVLVPMPGGGSLPIGYTATGFHAWFEVYYPDVGWIPHDAQKTLNWIFPHIYRSCHGLDEYEPTGPAQYSYAYIEPLPIIDRMGFVGSDVILDDNNLLYCGNDVIPTNTVIADWAGPFSSVDGRRADTADEVQFRASPSPFRHATTLTFSLASRREVRLAVYSVRGREVWTYDPAEYEVGSHSVEWKADDCVGGCVSAGVYYVVMEIDGERLVRKVVKAK